MMNKVSEVTESIKEVAADAKDTIMGPLANAGKNVTKSDSPGGGAGESHRGKKQE